MDHHNVSRQSRLILASKVISMIKANDKKTFSASELVNCESFLSDSFIKNHWLFNLCNSIVDGVFVTQEELDAFRLEDTKVVTEEQLDELKETLKNLQEKVSILRYEKEKLKKMISDVKTNAKVHELTRVTKNGKKKDDDIEKAIIILESELSEVTEHIKSELDVKSNIKDPKEIVEQIKLLEEQAIKNDWNVWLEELVKEMAVCNCDDAKVLDLSAQLNWKLQAFYENLLDVYNECRGIKNFYLVNVKRELEWKKDLILMMDELRDMSMKKQMVAQSNDEKKLNSNSSSSLKRVLDETKPQFSYADLDFKKSNDCDTDEIEELMETLRIKIETLQNLN